MKIKTYLAVTYLTCITVAVSALGNDNTNRPPVNLGRTSLATVNASSVNGERAMNSVYYGILNAFDDGTNWYNNINYTYWLSGGETDPWVEVTFDRPVTVTSVFIEQGPPFLAEFRFDKGKDQRMTSVKVGPESSSLDSEVSPTSLLRNTSISVARAVQGRSQYHQVEIPSSLAGVTQVRLVFGGKVNTEVHEIRIMGYVPPDTEYLVMQPKILPTQRNMELIAKDAFEVWKYTSLWKNVTKQWVDRGNTVVTTYQKDGIEIFRVTTDKATGDTRVEQMADWAPRTNVAPKTIKE